MWSMPATLGWTAEDGKKMRARGEVDREERQSEWKGGSRG